MATQAVRPFEIPAHAKSPHGNEAPVLSISSHVLISAPAPFVFEIFRDTSTWPAWNTFVPGCSVTQSHASKTASANEHVLNAQDEMMMQVRMTADASIRQQGGLVTDRLNVPDANGTYRIQWESKGMPKMMLRTLRTSEVVPTGEHTCEFRTWEVMAGPLAYVVKTMYGKVLQEHFEDCSQEIKGYAEKMWAAEHDKTEHAAAA